MTLFLDTSARGRHIKLGTAWVKLVDILGVTEVGSGSDRRLIITRRGRPIHVYRGGLHHDRVRTIVEREMGRE